MNRQVPQARKLQLELAYPANESREHFRLKHFARRWLYDGRAAACATEVAFRVWAGRQRTFWEGLSDDAVAERIARGYDKCRLHQSWRLVDCAGVSERRTASGKRTTNWDATEEDREIVSVGIEVKISRSDFLSGYHMPCQFNYVLVPKGLVDREELPGDVGLLYAGDRRYRWGMHMVRRAEERTYCALPGLKAALAIAKKLSGEWEYRLASDIQRAEGLHPREKASL